MRDLIQIYSASLLRKTEEKHLLTGENVGALVWFAAIPLRSEHNLKAADETVTQ